MTPLVPDLGRMIRGDNPSNSHEAGGLSGMVAIQVPPNRETSFRTIVHLHLFQEYHAEEELPMRSECRVAMSLAALRNAIASIYG